jgi:outer membrane murein-binding lipoprotein Lpp
MSEQTDIVVRLRTLVEHYPATLEIAKDDLIEAADEIEQLRDERDAARAEASSAFDQTARANDLIRLLQNEVRW